MFHFRVISLEKSVQEGYPHVQISRVQEEIRCKMVFELEHFAKEKKVCILPHKRNLDHRNTEVGRDLGKSPTQPQSRVSYQRWGVIIEAHPTSLYPDRPNTEDGNVQCTECSSVH